MTLQSDGPISINDIKGEFGGDVPDGIEEYYRDGGLVSSNNLNIPTCETADCPINFEQFYDGQLIHSKYITASQSYLVLSSLFTQDEWTSIAPKEVVINAGVTIGSYDPAIASCRTGILVPDSGGQPMGGTLKLINNGYIYGAGGNPNSGVGGIAFQAQILLTVQNNNRIYGGGGAGGIGGQGADCYWYFDTTSWRWTEFTEDWYTVDSFAAYAVRYKIISPIYDDRWNGEPDYLTKTFVVGVDGYYYERGSLHHDSGDVAVYYIRRRTNTGYAGGAGGNGGHGIGAYDPQGSGVAGVNPTHAGQGGTGGSGASWGATGGTGNNGSTGADSYHINYTSVRTGFAGGLGGYYIVGDANVTWEATGFRAGRVG